MPFSDDSNLLANQHKYVIDIYHVPTGKNVEFKAWISSFSDSYESNWDTQDVYGRMDPISTFQNTKRSITLEWDVVAASMEEAKQETNQETALGRIQKRVEALQPGTAGNTELLNEIRSLSGKVDVLKSEVERLRNQGKD